LNSQKSSKTYNNFTTGIAHHTRTTQITTSIFTTIIFTHQESINSDLNNNETARRINSAITTQPNTVAEPDSRLSKR